MLLILGARSVLAAAKDMQDAISRWAVQLAARLGEINSGCPPEASGGYAFLFISRRSDRTSSAND
jgi:hypothetical protein